MPADYWPVGWGAATTSINLYQCPNLPDEIISLTRTHTFVAHNATNFDAPAWNCLIDSINSPEWFDTIHCARAAGLPADLDTLGEKFAPTGKDKLGAAALEMLWTGKMTPDGIHYFPGTPNLWKMIIRYNIADVLILERVYNAVRQYADAPILYTHESINQRGIAFDRVFAERLVILWDTVAAKAAERLSELTGGKINVNNMRSGPAMLNWLKSQSIDIASLNRKELQYIYDDPDSFFGENDDAGRIIEVLRTRQMANRIGKSKISRALTLASPDERIRNLIVYHKAHTGRFAGQGLQPHNFSRGIGDLNVERLTRCIMDERNGCGTVMYKLVEIAAKDAETKSGKPCSIDDALSTVTRHMFVAPPGKSLCIADYASIEARILAWLADDTAQLKAFADGKDIYCVIASKLFGKEITKANNPDERDLGKRIELGCGYGMAWKKFAETCAREGCDIYKFGISPDECVEAYRDLHPKIAGVKKGQWRNNGLWQHYQAAVRHVINEPGMRLIVHKCWFQVVANVLEITLPSGRKLRYPEPRIEYKIPPWGGDEKPMIFYTHQYGYPVNLYGGKITENIDQGIGYDCLRHALVQADINNLPVVLHVHDEIVVETVSEDKKEVLERLCDAMLHLPSWAHGLPIMVEGFTAPRYTKHEFAGEYKCKKMTQ
jgi:DNA polymerase bacteriophage-type